MTSPVTARMRADAERFLADVRRAPEPGCWEWTGQRPAGYGRFYLNRHTVAAHRFAYELWVGPIPEGLTIDHLCRNRGCVNPAHLEPVTMRENILRGHGTAAQNAVKKHCLRGHPFDAENTYVHPATGKRDCRTCRTQRYRKHNKVRYPR